MTNFTIAKYNAEDINEISEVHMKAFKGYMNSQMGMNYIINFIKWFLVNDNCIALKATSNSFPIGYIVGAPIGYDSKINKDLLLIGLLGIITHPKVWINTNFIRQINARLKILLTSDLVNVKANLILPGKGISLVGIAVDPKFAGKKVGQSLMVKFENTAKELGFDYMRLSVYSSNKNAINVYQKSGWNILAKDNDIFYYFKKI